MAEMSRALRYMNGFVCLGAECEDTCCGRWAVPVDETHYDRLRDVMREAGRLEQFDSAFQPVAERARAPHCVAMLRPSKTAGCPYLEGGLCSIHRDYGEPVLSDACSTYPRLVSRVGDRRELAGSISCPEVARRALLDPGATDLVPADDDAFGRGALSQELRAGVDRARRLDAVRDAMYAILSSDRPVASRLFCLAVFGNELDEIVAERGDPDQLIAAAAPFAEPASMDQLSTMFQAAPEDGKFGIACALQILTAPFDASAGLHVIVERVLGSYAGAETVNDLWSAFEARREALPPAVAERIELCTLNYARSYCMTEWYSSAPRLRTYVVGLLARIASQRFLIIGHPDLREDTVDAIAVEVFYRFARAVDHSEVNKMTVLESAGRDFPTFGHIVPLLHV